MTDLLRNLRLVVGLAFRADPVRAFLLVVPLPSIGLVVTEWATREVVDAAIGGDRSRLWAGVALLGAGALFWVGLSMGRFAIDMRLRERVGLVLDERLIRGLTSIPTTDHFDRPDLADAVELLRTNRGELVSGPGAAANLFGTVANLVGAAMLLVTVEPRALLLPIAGIPLIFLAQRAASIQQATLVATAEEQRRALHLYDLATTPEAAEELRVFGAVPEILARHRRSWGEVERRRRRGDLQASALVGAGSLLLTGALVVVLRLIAVRASQGGVSPGDLVLVLSVLGHLAWQFRFLAVLGGWIVSIAAAAGRLRRVEDHAAALEQDAAWRRAPGVLPDRLRQGIRLRGVSFTYPGAMSPSLHAVDLDLPAGATVAVVGDNGAGKSTLISLLCGLRTPSTGRIEVDGNDLATIDPAQWRTRLSAGFQDHVRFELVAGETVGIGELAEVENTGAVLDALDRAGAGDIVGALPDGLDTALGTSVDGADLSGGEWQKLALGRAMRRNAPLLLVLDEPTSALDAESEHRLFDTYARAAAATAARTGTITILVSHRFSTVRGADLIVVVDHGRVVEVGTHAELRAAGGMYAELYELQAAAYR